MDNKTIPNPIVVSAGDKSYKPSFFRKIREPFTKFSPNFKKPAALALTVVLVFALVLGVYLVRKPTQLTPEASSTPENSFTLQAPASVITGEEFLVKVYSRCDVDNCNLWNAVLTFPNNLVEVVRFDKSGSFITSWTEEFFSNSTGEISLTGGVTSPGFKTDLSNALMTTIVFKANSTGPVNINLVDPSNIYRNSDNSKILQIKRDAVITVSNNLPSPSPSVSTNASPSSQSPSPFSSSVLASPSPTSANSSSPSSSITQSNKGDGNNDGKVNLQDLSIMFSKWSPALNVVSHFQLDFNDDLKINSFDYSEMNGLLKTLGVIKAN